MEFKNYRSTELYRLLPEDSEHLVLIKPRGNMDKSWLNFPVLHRNIKIGDKVYLLVNGSFFEVTCIQKGF